MAQRFFTFDPKKCFGCQSCVAACKLGRGLPIPVTWRRVGKLPPHRDMSDLAFISSTCCHCETPECLKYCPARAYWKRPQDGIVLHLDHRCLGCGYCTFVCPFGAPQLDRKKHIATKCDFCMDRIDQDMLPLCIETCPAGALGMVLVEDGEQIPKGYSRTMEGFLQVPGVTPSVLFKL